MPSFIGWPNSGISKGGEGGLQLSCTSSGLVINSAKGMEKAIPETNIPNKNIKIKARTVNPCRLAVEVGG